MGPDKGLTCAVYEAINCNDHGWIRAEPFVFPGITVYNEDKFLIRAGMEDGPTSVRCTYDSIKLHPAGNNGYNVHL